MGSLWESDSAVALQGFRWKLSFQTALACPRDVCYQLLDSRSDALQQGFSRGVLGWQQQYPVTLQRVRNARAPPCPPDSGRGVAIPCVDTTVRTCEAAEVCSNTQSLGFYCARDLRQQAGGVAFEKVGRPFLTFPPRLHCMNLGDGDRLPGQRLPVVRLKESLGP